MAMGDYCDYMTYVVRYVDLTSNVHSLVKFCNDVPSTCGGDAPEVRNPLLLARLIMHSFDPTCLINDTDNMIMAMANDSRTFHPPPPC